MSFSASKTCQTHMTIYTMTLMQALDSRLPRYRLYSQYITQTVNPCQTKQIITLSDFTKGILLRHNNLYLITVNRNSTGLK